MEKELRAGGVDVDAAAREAFLVDLYRQGRIARRDLAEVLGLDRFETEAVLKRHHVTEDLPSAEEILADARRLESLRLGR
jgi:hypothetical protein